MDKVGFLEESPGVKSITRQIFAVGVYWVMAMASYMIYIKAGNPIEIGAFITSSVAALGGVKYFGTRNEAK